MTITVILCTYNRSQMLANALDSVAASRLPESVEWKVLVVDNNSRDQTRQVAMEFCRRYPNRFRYLFEPRPGKSHALNAAIREVRTDVVAFMDDDVRVETTWLQNLTAALHNGEYAGAGGRILLDRTFPPPKWLSIDEPHQLAPLAFFDPGLTPGELAEPPFGTNMAFRRDVFEKYGDFRTDLGPQPDSEIRSEDTEFGNRLLQAGERLRYEPSAVVYHSVPQKRLTKQYFLAWWFDKARGDVREFGLPPETKWFVAGVPIYLLRRLSVWVLRWMIAVEPRRRFSSKLSVWNVAGQVIECYRQSREAKKKKSICSIPSPNSEA
jgi:glucosyl-dolichyl phosphate glucuronosyltransferase